MIGSAIQSYARDLLERALITEIEEDDLARAGVVISGPLQGDPLDPDEARIAIMVQRNDPDAINNSRQSAQASSWEDTVEEVEIGGATTWSRKFTVTASIILVDSAEALSTAQEIASKVQGRIEKALRTADWDIASDDEYVSRGAVSERVSSDLLQSGGPPDAYIFYLKVRFEVLTTTGVYA